MRDLIVLINKVIQKRDKLPFCICRSIESQNAKVSNLSSPAVIFIVSDQRNTDVKVKSLSREGTFFMPSGSFGMETSSEGADRGYLSLVIEFEYGDFDQIEVNVHAIDNNKPYVSGVIVDELYLTLQQFIQWSIVAPEAMWALRRRELLQMICHLGYTAMASLFNSNCVVSKVCRIIKLHIHEDISIERVCRSLGVSESNLRRKLRLENTNFKKLKNEISLRLAYQMVRETSRNIGYIAAECGYQSQSRLSQIFKSRYGMTPTALRKKKAGN